MDVKDPVSSVRHPLSGIATNGTDAATAIDDRAQAGPDYGDGGSRPKDIIGPRDIKEPDYADITDVVDTNDYKDVADAKDYTDVADLADQKDFVDIKDFVEPKDYKDIKDFK